MELTLTINVISLDVSGTLSCGQGAKRNSTDEKPSQFQLRSVLPTALGPTSGGRGAQEPGRVAAVPDRELPAGGPGGLSGFSALSRGRSLGTSHALRCSRMSQRTIPRGSGSLQKRGWGWGWGQDSPSEGTAPLLARKPNSGGPVPLEVPIAGLPAFPSCLQTCFSLPGSTAPTGYLETQTGRNKTPKMGPQDTQRRTPKPTSASLPNGH